MPDAPDSSSPSIGDRHSFPGCAASDSAPLAAWRACFQSWLAGYADPSTRRRYRYAVELCFAHLQKPPWEVSSTDLSSYLQTGLGDARLNSRYFHLKALRAFYRYALRFPGTDDLLIDGNPALDMTISVPQSFLKS
jgi:hypothetical protein